MNEKLRGAPAAIGMVVALVGGVLVLRASGRELSSAIHQAAEEFGVPEALLTAVVEVDSRGLRTTFSPRVRGWVRLTEADRPRSVERAARALRVDPALAGGDPTVGLRGAAALLARAASETQTPRNAPLLAWGPVLAAWNGGSMEGNVLYAGEVMAVARRGVSRTDDWGKPLLLAAATGAGGGTSTLPSPRGPEDLEGVPGVPFWVGASSGRRGERSPRKVSFIVLHTTETSFDGAFDYFRGEGTPVGAHYLVRASDGYAVQIHDERDVVFHDACFNEASVGIEQEGYVAHGERWYGEPLYEATARLVVDVAGRHGVPLDRAHVLGHSETPDCSDHEDPGPLWDWNHFMSIVERLRQAPR